MAFPPVGININNICLYVNRHFVYDEERDTPHWDYGKGISGLGERLVTVAEAENPASTS
jgi:hypothetical protein